MPKLRIIVLVVMAPPILNGIFHPVSDASRTVDNSGPPCSTCVEPLNECRILPYISDVPLAKLKAAMAAQAAPVEPEAVAKPTQGGPAMPSPENLPSKSWLADAGYWKVLEFIWGQQQFFKLLIENMFHQFLSHTLW